MSQWWPRGSRLRERRLGVIEVRRKAISILVKPACALGVPVCPVGARDDAGLAVVDLEDH